MRCQELWKMPAKRCIPFIHDDACVFLFARPSVADCHAMAVGWLEAVTSTPTEPARCISDHSWWRY